MAVQANSRVVVPLARRVAHGRDYKPRAVKRTLGAPDVAKLGRSIPRCSGQVLRPYKFNRLVFGPAEGGEGLLEAGEGQADNVEIAAFDARNVAAGAALDGISTCFVMWFAG